MTAAGGSLVPRLWALCHVLRDDGITYHQYVEELAPLLFLKMAQETGAQAQLPAGARWDDLKQTAAEKARRVDVRGAIPYRAPRLWPVPFGAAVALLIVWIAVPRFDVLGLFAKKQNEIKKQQEILAVKEERKADEKKLDDLLKRAKVEFKDEQAKDGKEGEQAKELDPEAIRRAAVRDLTNLSEKLQETLSDVRQRGTLTEDDVAKAMREVRLALLEVLAIGAAHITHAAGSEDVLAPLRLQLQSLALPAERSSEHGAEGGYYR